MTQFRKSTKPKRWSWLGISCLNALVVSLLVFSGIENASAGPSFQTVTVRFKVNATPYCGVTDLTGSDEIKVDFGTSLPMSQIDGSQHEKPIPYQIYCDNPTGYTQLKIRFIGANAGFGDRLLATDQDNLAIEIRQGGVALPVGTGIVFDPQYGGGAGQYVNGPSFTAVPVRRAGSNLTEGLFNANATLVLEYV